MTLEELLVSSLPSLLDIALEDEFFELTELLEDTSIGSPSFELDDSFSELQDFVSLLLDSSELLDKASELLLTTGDALELEDTGATELEDSTLEELSNTSSLLLDSSELLESSLLEDGTVGQPIDDFGLRSELYSARYLQRSH